MITKVLAKELGPRNIRVNTVSPGLVETERIHATGMIESSAHKEIIDHTPLGRIGQPKDIAPMVVFLAGPKAEWITSGTFHVSGGLS